MTTVQQVFTGDASQLQREYEKLARSVTTLEGKIGQATAKSEQLAKANIKSMDAIGKFGSETVRELTSAIAGYVSLTSLASAYNKVLEDRARIETEAFDKTSQIGKSQATLALNVLDDAELKRVTPQISQIAKDQRFPGLDKLTEATAEAISAAGGNIDLALRGVRTAAGLTRLSPEALRPMTGATIDAARASGASTDEAAALVLSAGKTGRVVDPRQQADVMGKGIGGIVASSRGDRKQSAEQAAEMIAAITVLMGDKMGDRSTTAAMSLSAQLDKFFTEGYKVRLGDREFTRKPDQDPGMLLDRVAKLQNNAKLAEAFLKNAHFEAGAESIIKRILREPRGVESTTLADARKTVGYDTSVIQQVQKSLEAGTPQLRSADTESKLIAAKELSQVIGPDAIFGEARAMRKRMTDDYGKYSSRFYYDPMGGDYFSTTASDIAASVFPGAGSQVSWLAANKSMATERIRQIEAKRDLTGHAATWLGKRSDDQLSAQERSDRDALRLMERRFDELIAAFKAQQNTSKQQLDTAKEQLKATRETSSQNKPAPLIPAGAARGMIGAGRER